jgi:hypothetical protein
VASTRCKMRCNEIIYTLMRTNVLDEEGNATKDESGAWVTEEFKQPTVKLAPVYSDDPNSENKLFWTATPSGSVQLAINNPRGAEVFEIGKEYYVDFTLVD